MWTVNCLVCHTAEIDGVTYLGAGTKVFDDYVAFRRDQNLWFRFAEAGFDDFMQQQKL